MPAQFDEQTFRTALAHLGTEKGDEREPRKPGLAWILKALAQDRDPSDFRGVRVSDLVALLSDPKISGLEFSLTESPDSRSERGRRSTAKAPWGETTGLALLDTVERLQFESILSLLGRLTSFVNLLKEREVTVAQHSQVAEELVDAEDQRIAAIAAGPPPKAARGTPDQVAPPGRRDSTPSDQKKLRAVLNDFDDIARDIRRVAHSLDSDAAKLRACFLISSATAAAAEVSGIHLNGKHATDPDSYPVARALVKIQSSLRDIEHYLGSTRRGDR